MEQDAMEVVRLYSTKPTRVRLGNREWVIPANYFGPKQRDEPDVFDAEEYFGFVLFLPDFVGYTRDNWQDPFDPGRIDVLETRLVDKDAMLPLSSGGKQRVEPANYGEPRARYANRKPRLEKEPAFNMYGLQGYLWKNRRRSGVTWTGTRSNGEFFFFYASFAPGEPHPRGVQFGDCDVRYYSEKNDLFVAYRYKQDHIAKWREIDDAIWEKLHQWRAS